MHNCLAANWNRLGLEHFGPPKSFTFILHTPQTGRSVSRHVVLLVVESRSAKPVLVAKISRTPGENSMLDKETRNLRMLHGLHTLEGDSIPWVLSVGSLAGRGVLVQTAVQGRRMTPDLIRHDFQTCADAVVPWLTRFHCATAAGAPCDFHALVEAPLARYSPWLVRNAETEWLVEQLTDLLTPLCHVSLPTAFEHGDFFYPNILLLGGKVRVLDWETGSPDCFPAGDLFFFLAHSAFARAGWRYKGVRAFEEAFFPTAAWMRPYLRMYVDALQIETRWLTSLFIAFWTRFLFSKIERQLAGSRLHALPRPQDQDEIARYIRESREFAVWRHALVNVERLEWRL